jgi:hypothetical protein
MSERLEADSVGREVLSGMKLWIFGEDVKRWRLFINVDISPTKDGGVSTFGLPLHIQVFGPRSSLCQCRTIQMSQAREARLLVNCDSVTKHTPQRDLFDAIAKLMTNPRPELDIALCPAFAIEYDHKSGQEKVMNFECLREVSRQERPRGAARLTDTFHF